MTDTGQVSDRVEWWFRPASTPAQGLYWGAVRYGPRGLTQEGSGFARTPRAARRAIRRWVRRAYRGRR
jgi:hypothetical protein